ncbi:MAG: nickel pincer cofactor biosynthesis protein LarC [bacterium]
MKILYFDCYAGLSGDMTLGALVELGLSLEWLSRQIDALPLEGITLSSKPVGRGALSGTKIDIQMPDPTGKQGRTLKDFVDLLKQGDLPHDIRDSAIGIFTKIAQAEATVHRKSIDNIHFHELGSLDSLIDIVGTLLGIKAMGIEKLFASPLNLGTGFTTTAHGTIPVPSPATLELLAGLPVYSSGLHHELVTPTGAALMSTLVSDFGPLPPCRIQRIGYGAGSRNLEEIPNLLRVVMGTTVPDWHMELLSVLETDIDDMNPEYYDHLITRLFSAEALDVSLSPLIMKKNRPATRVTVLCHPSRIEALCALILRETTTLGIRIKEVWRKAIQREIISVESSFGPVRIKIGTLDGKVITAAPEYEDCRHIALKENLPLKHVYEEALKNLRRD